MHRQFLHNFQIHFVSSVVYPRLFSNWYRFMLKIKISTQHFYDLKKKNLYSCEKNHFIHFQFYFWENNLLASLSKFFPVCVKKESHEKCPNPALVQITVTGGNLKFVDQTFRQIEDRIKEKHVKMVIFILGKFIFHDYNSICNKCIQRQKIYYFNIYYTCIMKSVFKQ